MSCRKFTAEEIEYLRGNENVIDANANYVYFSAKYKGWFYQELVKGKKPAEIFIESGINPDVLGKSPSQKLFGISIYYGRQETFWSLTIYDVCDVRQKHSTRAVEFKFTVQKIWSHIRCFQRCCHSAIRICFSYWTK